MKYTQLKGWRRLKPDEKKRFKEVHGDRFAQEYNEDGSHSTSEKELEKESNV